MDDSLDGVVAGSYALLGVLDSRLASDRILDYVMPGDWTQRGGGGGGWAGGQWESPVLGHWTQRHVVAEMIKENGFVEIAPDVKMDDAINLTNKENETGHRSSSPVKNGDDHGSAAHEYVLQQKSLLLDISWFPLDSRLTTL
ncbi:hypothetical protein CAPTEDRAFT_197380 [Capitella teleta]|uniref:Uncharacterized protein n=1 Tax=Capitella teleta TaxID=283909 RepID=R7TW71_CAPTE|nr:hypothetical protein CAPTEDRAFT_197380 [Capitella teleta]|eukprot:ELT95701.1 hypothetical protein CAPTEDRAFT_197380 [Capitella teleta]